jgi:radical SAM superfamily enzyme YgiQ (UPF0313 family)
MSAISNDQLQIIRTDQIKASVPVTPKAGGNGFGNRRLKILLVECEENYFDSWGRGMINEVILPIGLMYLASSIRERFGDDRLEVKIYDLSLDNMMLDVLRTFRPDIVGVRGVTKNLKIVHEVAKIVREFDKDVLILAGGPYITADHDTALLDRNLDYGVVGEGEVVFPKIIDCVLRGERERIRELPAVANFDESTQEVKINCADTPADLDAIPYPSYDLIDQNRYANVIGNAKTKRKQGVIFSSRGCPYSCIYCHNIFGKKIRVRTPENFFNEIKFLYDEYGIRDFFFVDDLFNIQVKRSIAFCDLVIRSNMKVKLYFQNGFRADICTPELIDACVDAGMILVNFALESASPRLQKLMKKYVKIDRLQQVVHYTCGKDIIVGLNTMVGFPTETWEEAIGTLKFLAQFKKLALPFFFIARYYPNTEMWNIAIDQGANPIELNRHASKVFHDTTMGTPTFSKEQVRKLLHFFMLNVFFDKERLLNVQKILEKHFSEEDISDFYSTILSRKITDVKRQVLDISRDNTVRGEFFGNEFQDGSLSSVLVRSASAAESAEYAKSLVEQGLADSSLLLADSTEVKS